MELVSKITPEAVAAKGYEAMSLGDWATVVSNWTPFGSLYQAAPEGFFQLGEALWRLQRFPAADDILKRGMEKYPASDSLALSYAWSGFAQRNWIEAERRFATVLARFPDSAIGRFGMSLTLRELGRLEEAESVILEGPDYDNDPPSRRFLAELATALKKFDVAIARWTKLITVETTDPQLHCAFVACLRAAGREPEAEQALGRASELFPQDPDIANTMIEMAEMAGHVGDLPLALRRWNAFKTAYGSRPEGYVGAASVLARLGRLEDAEVLMTPAVRLFSQNLDVLAQFADIAMQAGRWTEAIARWSAVQKLAPDRSDGFLGEVSSLRGAGKIREAEDLLAKLVVRFRSDLPVAFRYAEEAQERGAWQEAIARWRVVMRKFPGEGRPRSELVRCLTNAGDFAAAEKAAAESLALPARNLDLLLARAENATRAGELELARARWAALVEDAPDFGAGPVGYARLLIRTGQVDQGIAMLEAAAPRFRNDFLFNLEHARILTELSDWPRALPIWAEIWPRVVSSSTIRSETNRILALAQQDLEIAAAESPGGPPPFVIPPVMLRTEADAARERESARALLMQFESLGDSCEFGMVQRRFGAEPLGLLRWSGTGPDSLAAAFRARFAGVGEPEFTEIGLLDGEYITTDTRYHMFTHTFTHEAAAPRDKFYAMQCKRIRFLREKLLQDLANPEKIFLYSHRLLNDQLTDELFDAMRSVGPRITLVCVRLADKDHPAGSVRFRREGLLVGAIGGFSTADIAVDEWLQLCAAAAEMTAGTMRQVA